MRDALEKEVAAVESILAPFQFEVDELREPTGKQIDKLLEKYAKRIDRNKKLKKVNTALKIQIIGYVCKKYGMKGDMTSRFGHLF